MNRINKLNLAVLVAAVTMWGGVAGALRVPWPVHVVVTFVICVLAGPIWRRKPR